MNDVSNYFDKYIYVDGKFNEEILCLEEVASVIIGKLGLPVFIKPSNSPGLSAILSIISNSTSILATIK